MKDENKTKAQLIDEMAALRQRVTELEQVGSAQQSVGQALREWETAFDALSDWICLIDPVTREIMRSNRSGEEIVGLPLAEMVGQSCCQLLHGSDQPLPGCPVNESLRTRRRATLDLEAPDVHRWFSITVDPVLDDHGDVAAVVHVARDITQWKRAQESLMRRTQDVALINKVNDAVNRDDSLADVIELLSGELKKALPCDGATLYLLSDDQEYLLIQNLTLPPARIARIEKLIGTSIPDLRIRLKEGSLYRRILEDAGAQIINDAKTIKRLMAECTEDRLLKKLVGEIYRFLDTHAVICVPLMEDGRPIGLLDVSRSEPFSEADADRLKSIAPQLIGCLQRKRMDDALRESEERYRSLFDGAIDHIFVVDRNLRYQAVNRSALEAGGFTLEDAVGKGPQDLFAGDADFYVSQYRRPFETGQPGDFERPLELPDGVHWYSVRLSPILDAAGNVTAVTGISRDISERKRAEEALAEERDRAQGYLDVAGVMLVAIDADQRVTLINQKGCEILGYEENEILRKNWFDTFLPERLRDSVKAVFAELVAGEIESVQHFENPVLTSTGEERVIAWYNTVITDSEGNITGALSSGEDITERKRAETQLEQRTEDVQLLNALNDAVNRGADLQTVIELMSSELKRTLPCNGATLYLLSDDQEYLVIQNLTLRSSTAARIEALIGGTIPEVRIRLKEGSLYRRILEDGDAQIINDVETIKRLMVECTENRLLEKLVEKAYRFLDLHSVICVPLMEDGKAIGLLGVSRSEPFSEADADRLKSVAPQLIGCLQRKRMEDARRESEERYRLLFENSPICLWEQDFSDVKRYLEDLQCSGVSDFRAYFGKHPEAVRECTSLVKIADVNRTALDFYQAETKAELLRGLDQVFAEESYDVFVEELASIAEGRTQFDGESVARTLGGERKDIALRWSVSPGFEETLARVVVSDVDITERARAQEALRESEERYRQVFQQSPAGIGIASPDGRIIMASKAMQDITGYSADELLEINLADTYENRQDRTALVEAMSRDGAVHDYAVRLKRKDGIPYDALLSIESIRLGGKDFYHTICQDVTQRKRTEEQLLYQANLLENVSDAIISTDIDFNIMSWNRAAETIYGWKADEVIGKPVHVVTKLEYPYDRMEEVVDRFLEEGYWRGEVIQQRKDGEAINVLASVSMLRNHAGDPVGAVAVNRDITERKRAEQEIRQQNKELEALNAIAATLSSSLNLGEILDSALNKVLEFLAVEAGGIYLVDETSRRLTLMAHHGVSEEFVSQVGELAVDEETIARATEMGKAGKLILATEVLLRDTTLLKAVTTAIGREKLRSYLQAIIRSKGTSAGLLVVASREGREFTAREEQLLSTIAHQIGLAVENVNLYEEQVDKVFQMDALRKTTLDITSELDLNTVLRSIAGRAVQLLRGTGGGLYLYRPEADLLEWAVSIGEGLAPVGTTLQRGEGLSGKVWETGQPLIVDGYSHWEGRSRRYEAHRFEAVVGVPVHWQEKFLGVLNVLTDAPRTFSSNDAELLSLFASQAAIAIENARLYEAANDRLAELTTLQKTSLRLTQTLDSAEVLDTVTRSVLHLFQATDVHIFLYDAETDELSFAASAWDEPQESRSAYRAPRKDGLTAQVARSGRPLLVSETRSHPLFVDYDDRRANMEAAGGFPLKVHDRVIGVFNIAFDSPHTFDEHELRIAGLLADQAAIAIENARLYAEQERRAREMTALYETSLDISGRLVVTDVLRSIMNRGVELLHTAGGAVWLYRPGEDELELAVDYGNPETYVGGRMKVGEGVSGKVFATGQAMAVEDYRQWEGRSRKYDSDIIGGMLGVPLMWGVQAIGVLNVNEIEKPRRFTEEEVRLLSLFASQAAVAIQNARLHEEQERTASEMTALYETSLDISGRLTLPDLLRSIMNRGVDLLGASGAAVWLYRPEDEKLEFVVEHGGPEIHVGGRLKVGEGLAGKVFQTREPIAVEDYSRWEGRSQRLDSGVIGGMVGVPLLWGEQAIGVLEVDEIEKPRRFTKEEVRLLTLFASQAAVAIQNARLHEETETRRRYLETLEGISSTLRSTLPLSDVLDQIVHGTTEALDYTGAAIALPDHGGERLSLGTVSGGKLVDAALKLAGRSLGSFTLPLTAEDNLIVRAFLTGEFQASSGEPEGLAAGAEPPISPRVARAMEKMMGTKSAVCVPLRSGETTVGVLIAMSPRERLADEERAMLVGLADQGGLAMENARLFEETRRREAQLAALHDVSLEIVSELDLQVLLKTVAQRAVNLLGGPGGGLYLYRPERQELEMVVILGWEHDYLGTTLRLGEGACGRAAQTGQPLVVVDYANWEGRSASFEDEGNFNVLAVPIKHGDSLLGALYVEDPDLERRFDEADIDLTTMFANQAAIAIENVRLHQEQQQRAEELAALHETALDITSHLDLDSLLAAVIARATRLLGAPSGDIYLHRPDEDDLKNVASLGMPPQLEGTALKRGEGLTGMVFETGEPLAVEDYEAWDGRSAQYAGYGFSRALGAPLRHGTRSVGVLVVDRPADAPCFTERDANLLTLFANQATIAIENAQLLHAVAKHKENLQELSSRLIDAQEQERKWIAQELHDELGQALTAMSINLSAIDKQLGAELDSEIAERLAETDTLITRTLEQMREMALDLRPSMLDDLGLLPALRWYVKRYENRTGILVGLEAVGLELRLPEQIETVIYRMVQEALTNVARHARANRVDIRLQRRDSIVQAFIEDDGSGFDLAEVADREAQERGVGLVGMRERIAALGGSLEVKSHPGKGTRLAIELPLP